MLTQTEPLNDLGVAARFRQIQDTICRALETTDGGAVFRTDDWERPGGGGGRTRVIQDGAVLEKGGVNFSAVHGPLSERMRKALDVPAGSRFFATGVSLVLHPRSPRVPISHANIRYFSLDTGESWFGGGIDLTPVYVDEADARWFHQQLKRVCDRHHPAFYDRFKAWADEYFYLPHRGETRGVGGIFFDYLQAGRDGLTADALFDFVQDVGEAFPVIYTHLMEKTRNLPTNEREKQWQLLRRGRYAEFNLVYDRGTKFGLESDGRTESILMSLPPLAAWAYDHRPEPGSEEAQTLALLRPGIDWAN